MHFIILSLCERLDYIQCSSALQDAIYYPICSTTYLVKLISLSSSAYVQVQLIQSRRYSRVAVFSQILRLAECAN